MVILFLNTGLLTQIYVYLIIYYSHTVKYGIHYKSVLLFIYYVCKLLVVSKLIEMFLS